MEAKKYEKLIMTGFNTKKDEIGTLLFTFDNKVADNNPFFSECAWVWPKPGKIVMEEKPHSHEYDELITLFGSNPDDPKDLCGEVEFRIGDEEFTIINSCVIYIPKGVIHCPLIFHKVERPIFHYIVGNAPGYKP